MEFFAGILSVLKLLMIPACICTLCLCIDTYIQIKYYLWNKQNRSAKPECKELENVAQYDANFFDDCK